MNARPETLPPRPSLSLPSDAEGLRRALAEEGRRNLFFFARDILGWDKLSDGLHREVCAFLQRLDRFKLLQLPRGHLKTTLCTISYPLWRVVQNPNIRILLRSATSKNAQNWVIVLQDLMLGNPIFRWLYPELIPRDFQAVRWNQEALEVPRTQHWPEATIEAIGGSATAVSRHYDLIIEDDLVNEDHLISDEQMRKVIDEHRRGLSLFVNPGVGERVTVGNRWAYDDLVSWIEANEPLVAVYKRAAVEHDRPIWPESFSLDTLNQILETQGPRIYSAQYMNAPCHEDARSFDPSWFRYIDSPPTVPVRTYVALDPAISKKKHADRTAIVVVGVDADRNYYVLDVRSNRWGVDELIDQLFEVVRTWRPQKVAIESLAFQKVLQYPIREAMRRENVHFPIHDAPQQGSNKVFRIMALHEYFNNGSLWLRKGVCDGLVKELSEFPYGAHDDQADALAFAMAMARPANKALASNADPLLLDNILLELQRQHDGPRQVWSFHGKPVAA